MLDSTAEKLELCRLLARAQGKEEPSKKSALLRAAATEARNWADFYNRRSLETMTYGEDYDEGHY